MNELTEHELKILIWAINYARERTTDCSDATSRVKKKIQTMIDNYDSETLNSKVVELWNCEKCGHVQ